MVFVSKLNAVEILIMYNAGQGKIAIHIMDMVQGKSPYSMGISTVRL